MSALNIKNPSERRAILVLNHLIKQQGKLKNGDKDYNDRVIAGYIRAQYVILGVMDSNSSWHDKANVLEKELENAERLKRNELLDSIAGWFAGYVNDYELTEGAEVDILKSIANELERS